MDSIKTKTDNYSIVNGKAVAGVVLVPKAGGFIGYVAWEWEEEAKKKNFAIVESNHIIGYFDSEWIDKIADYGNDVTHKEEIRNMFPQLF